jgi:hypothetical protein
MPGKCNRCFATKNVNFATKQMFYKHTEDVKDPKKSKNREFFFEFTFYAVKFASFIWVTTHQN